MTPQTVTKAERVSALTTAQSRLQARFYTATMELDAVKRDLSIVDAQLLIMTGLDDAPAETSDAPE